MLPKERIKEIVSPFIPEIRDTVIDSRGREYPVPSYGLDTVGYTVRVGTEYTVISGDVSIIVGDWDSIKNSYQTHKVNLGDLIHIPPFGFVLVKTWEYITMPPDVKGEVTPKTSYMRAGIATQSFTLIDPSFEGYLLIGLFNPTPQEKYVRSGSGLVLIHFEEVNPYRLYREHGLYHRQINAVSFRGINNGSKKLREGAES